MGQYLSKNRVERLAVVNNKWVNVILKDTTNSSGSGNPSMEKLWFAIGSVDTFERNLETAQMELQVRLCNYIPRRYLHTFLFSHLFIKHSWDLATIIPSVTPFEVAN